MPFGDSQLQSTWARHTPFPLLQHVAAAPSAEAAAEVDVADRSDRKYHGVSKDDRGKSIAFYVEIGMKKQRYHLGTHKTAPAAAKAYDWAARLIGEGKQLNFPPEEDLGDPPQTEGAARLIADLARTRGPPANGGSKAGAAMPATGNARHLGPQGAALSPGVQATLPKRGAHAAPPSPLRVTKRHAASDEPPPGAAQPGNSRDALVLQLRLKLRLRRLREDDLALEKLGEGPLLDILSDLGDQPPREEQAESLKGYTLIELVARVRVNVRLLSIEEAGLDAELGKLRSAEMARAMLLDLLLFRRRRTQAS